MSPAKKKGTDSSNISFYYIYLKVFLRYNFFIVLFCIFLNARYTARVHSNLILTLITCMPSRAFSRCPCCNLKLMLFFILYLLKRKLMVLLMFYDKKKN